MPCAVRPVCRGPAVQGVPLSAFGMLGYLTAAGLAVVPLFVKGEALDRTSRSLLLVRRECIYLHATDPSDANQCQALAAFVAC